MLTIKIGAPKEPAIMVVVFIADDRPQLTGADATG
jgi:hypothetical protein